MIRGLSEKIAQPSLFPPLDSLPSDGDDSPALNINLLT